MCCKHSHCLLYHAPQTHQTVPKHTFPKGTDSRVARALSTHTVIAKTARRVDSVRVESGVSAECLPWCQADRAGQSPVSCPWSSGSCRPPDSGTVPVDSGKTGPDCRPPPFLLFTGKPGASRGPSSWPEWALSALPQRSALFPAGSFLGESGAA